MRTVRSYATLYITACLLIGLIGCTAAEWAQIGDDAAAAAPTALQEALTNPNPIAWGSIAIAFLSGLIAKSAARGFGKGAVATTKGAVSLGTIFRDMVISLFARK